ncbi:MAG: acyl carrier protein [Pyrinomonadaceae bacterium]|nr:acyl carrier protein [Acidobacteriota bacterium]
MHTDDTRSRLIKCFAVVFPELSEEEIPRASATSVESWDSVASVTLMSVIDEEFGIELDADSLEHLVSFEQMLDYLQRVQLTA